MDVHAEFKPQAEAKTDAAQSRAAALTVTGAPAAPRAAWRWRSGGLNSVNTYPP